MSIENNESSTNNTVLLDSPSLINPKESANHLSKERFVKWTLGGKSICLIMNDFLTKLDSGNSSGKKTPFLRDKTFFPFPKEYSLSCI
jgi:hypothetical protein